MIYFIHQQNEYVKIGYTNQSVKTRMQALQVGNPILLSIYTVIEGDLDAEAALHKRFKRHHIRGEWYVFHDDIKRYVGSLDTIVRKARIRDRARAINGMTPQQISEYMVHETH